jgi:hypothetical protein
MEIMEKLETLAQDINAAGIPSTMDPRNLDAPGAIVELNELGPDNTMCGDFSATANVYLVAPDNGRVEATANLLSMYDKVKHLTTGATTIELALPDTAPLPALKLSPIELI